MKLKIKKNTQKHNTDSGKTKPFFLEASLLGLLSFQSLSLSFSAYLLCSVTQCDTTCRLSSREH